MPQASDAVWYDYHSKTHNEKKHAGDNPMFGDNQNQIGLYAGWGTAGGSLEPDFWKFAPFGLALLSYSQPTTIFRLPGRQNFHIGSTIGWEEKYDEIWRDYSWPLVGLSWDVSLINFLRPVYAGTGLGTFIKWDKDIRQDSRFMFGFKLFIGYRMTDKFSMEIFTQHYSNGNLTPINGSYNFVGLAALVSF